MGFFSRFFARFFAPEVESLRRQIADSQRQINAAEKRTQFWRDRFDDEQAAHGAAKDDLKREINSNRRREDNLRDQILRINGGDALPARVLTAAPKVEPAKLTGEEESVLRQRAVDYCEQTLNADFTQTDVEEIYQKMRLAPNDWLVD